MLAPKDEFLREWKFDSVKFDKAGIEWAVLEDIYQNYLGHLVGLNEFAKTPAFLLQGIKNVHSVRWRIKQADHLIAKIIRKSIHREVFDYCVADYLARIQDVMGLRCIHLFKEDWAGIHDKILGLWHTDGDIEAHIAFEDPAYLHTLYGSRSCKLVFNDRGYRSVHYCIRVPVGKEVHIAEVQVRTILEESWGEIDHKLKYPVEPRHHLITSFLHLINQLTEHAEVLASIGLVLHNYADVLASTREEDFPAKTSAKKQLRDYLERLNDDKSLRKKALPEHARMAHQKLIEQIDAISADS